MVSFSYNEPIAFTKERFDSDEQLSEYIDSVLQWEDVPWNDIAEKFLHVNYKWLLRWRDRVGYSNPRWTPINDQELDDIVYEKLSYNPNCGEVIMEGYLRARCIRVTRARLRASILRVDPTGRANRRMKQIKRRVYSVPGPHHLWHIDGLHKLIHFGIVIHGGIDGFSRACTFVNASDNNRAETMDHAFRVGVDRYGCPSRVRSDKGGENRLVGWFMLDAKGFGRGSMLTGKSTQNQRIERFWRDVTAQVLSRYRTLFYHIQYEYQIDFGHPVPLFCLHYLFLGKLNQDLDDFRGAWNAHKIRTEKPRRSPNQMLRENQHLSAAVQVDTEEYGVDENYDSEDDEPEHDQVVLEPLFCPLSPTQYQAFSQQITPVVELTMEQLSMSQYPDYFRHALEVSGVILMTGA